MDIKYHLAHRIFALTDDVKSIMAKHLSNDKAINKIFIYTYIRIYTHVYILGITYNIK